MKLTPRTRRIIRWSLAIVAALFLMSVVTAELVARYKFGLGDPPLSMADPKIEYLFKPSATYHRFGNTITYNAWSMRSDDFPQHKADPSEYRVLVIGDSVVNGGALTDQADLATSILQRDLHDNLHRPVVVANISAGSWGPPNQLAYLKRFGLFDADAVILVFSTHDYADVPTFKPIVGIDPDMPAKKPVLALQEAVGRYLPHYLGYDTAGSATNPQTTAPQPAEIEQCKQAIREMVGMARRQGARVAIAQHLSAGETPGQEPEGYRVIAALARDMNVRLIQLGPALHSSNQLAYRDFIHPNAHGQKLIAQELEPVILEWAGGPGVSVDSGKQ